MDEACAEELFGDIQGQGGGGSRFGSGGHALGDMFTSPDTSKKIAMIS
jgi:hypothetical protein